MTGFYALILDDILDEDGTHLDLIQSGATLDALREVESFDPNGAFSRVLRDRFDVTLRDDHPLYNSETHVMNPAHICRLVAK